MFFLLWFELFKDHPIAYIDAFLNMNSPYWYQNAFSRDYYSQRRYIETAINLRTVYPLERESKLPGLLNYYERVAGFYEFDNKPIVSLLFSIATPIWFVLICGFVQIIRKSYRKLLILIPMITLWLTYIVGPVCNFRYIIPIFLLYPFLLFLVIDKQRIEE